MRKIKFRVWHKQENRWLDPWAEEDPILSLKDFGEGCEVYLYDREQQEHSNKNCQMEDLVIQQYTNIKDKNGKEIYEGDIVEYPFYGELDNPNKDKMKVVFYNYGYYLDSMSKTYGGVKLLPIPHRIQYQYIEVIGNICENPELLK